MIFSLSDVVQRLLQLVLMTRIVVINLRGTNDAMKKVYDKKVVQNLANKKDVVLYYEESCFKIGKIKNLGETSYFTYNIDFSSQKFNHSQCNRFPIRLHLAFFAQNFLRSNVTWQKEYSSLSALSYLLRYSYL